jgi:pilus assembly protein CpaE
MSQQGDVTSILLPSSRVDVYALDDGTAGTVQKLAADWRFARVAMRIERAGMDAAVAHYAENPSPELLIIETNDISEAFIAKLGELAGVCGEGTDAVIIGPTNDVRLYRDLVGMGVKDYLVRPVAEKDMVGVIAKTLVEKRGLSNARLVAVVGGKGGVGATAIAQVLAWITGEKMKQKTLLMDLAGSNSTLGIAYGVEPSTSFSECVRIGASGSEDDMKRIVQQAGENLSILVCGGEPILNARPDPDAVETLVSRLLQKHPVVVVDLSGASRAVQKRILGLASEVVLVTTPFLSALRNTRTYMGEIKSVRASLAEVSLIVNMQGMAGGEEVPVKDISAALDMPVTAKIPYAPKVFMGSEASGKPVGQDKNAGDILRALAPVAARAAGVEAAAEPDAGGPKKDDPFTLLKKKLGKGK